MEWTGILIGGLACCAISLFLHHPVLSAAAGVAGFTMLWSIKELKEQEERVKKGWFPAKTKRRKSFRTRSRTRSWAKTNCCNKGTTLFANIWQDFQTGLN